MIFQRLEVILLFKATFDKIRDRYWWRTMWRDVAKHMKCCSSCQHRKTSHRAPKLRVGHRPVSRPFQHVAVNLVEYKSSLNNSKCVMSVIDHLTWFLVANVGLVKPRLLIFNTFFWLRINHPVWALGDTSTWCPNVMRWSERIVLGF